MQVPLLDLKAQYATIRAEVRKAIDEVCDQQHFILGSHVEDLERLGVPPVRVELGLALARENTLGPLDPFNLYQIPLEHHQQKIHVRKEEPLRRELEDFLHAIQEKRPPLVTGEDAVDTLRVAIAATESHRTGKLVQLT